MVMMVEIKGLTVIVDAMMMMMMMMMMVDDDDDDEMIRPILVLFFLHDHI
jgi:hypothetical protein